VTKFGVGAAGARRLLVSVESPAGLHTLAVPLDSRVEDLIPALVQACEGRTDASGWKLAPKGEAPLDGSRTIRECGLFRGAVLLLSAPDVESAIPAPTATSPGADGFPTAATPDLAGRLKARLRPAEPAAAIDRAGEAAYLRMLEDAIVAARAGASSVVAVMSVHPGAGTTTVTALLATLLSGLRGDRIAIVDANTESGALSHWMSPDSGVSGDGHSSLFGVDLTPDQVQEALVSAGTGLWVLPASADPPGVRTADAAAWRRLIEHLRHLHNTVIIDCGAGVQRPACQAALESANQVVLVYKPQPGEPERMAPTINAIRGRGPTVVVVANQARRRARMTQSLDGVQHVTIAYEKAPALRLKTRGFSWRQAPASWQEGVRELAAVLAGSAALSED
jgi:MinD-like ATPase involved in chromosome partitioning or flagellar assembly